MKEDRLGRLSDSGYVGFCHCPGLCSREAGCAVDELLDVGRAGGEEAYGIPLGIGGGFSALVRFA